MAIILHVADLYRVLQSMQGIFEDSSVLLSMTVEIKIVPRSRKEIFFLSNSRSCCVGLHNPMRLCVSIEGDTYQ